MFKVTLILPGSALGSLPYDKAQDITIQPVSGPIIPITQGRPVGTTPLQLPLIYAKAPYGGKRIDVPATLAHHGVSRTDIKSRYWPRNSWQRALKYAIIQQRL